MADRDPLKDDDEDEYGIFTLAPKQEEAEAEADDDDEYGIFTLKAPRNEDASPPAWEPKNWWEDILGKANEVVSIPENRAPAATAALQGMSVNTLDNLVRRFSDSSADYVNQAAKDFPGSHGFGQAVPSIGAAIAAPATIPWQVGVQAGLGGAASAFDDGTLGDVSQNAAIGAVSGLTGELVGRGLGAVGRYAGKTKPGKWLGETVESGLERLWPTRGPKAIEEPLENIFPLDHPLAQGADEAYPNAGEKLLRLPRPAPVEPGPVGPPLPPGMSAPPPKRPVSLDEAFPSSPPPPAPAPLPIPSGPPPPPPPSAPYPPSPSARPPAPAADEDLLADLAAGWKREKAYREGGQFAKRPYETPGEMLLRPNGPHTVEGLRAATPLSEPPLPIAEPPPVPFSEALRRDWSAPPPKPPEPLLIDEPPALPSAPYRSPLDQRLRLDAPEPMPSGVPMYNDLPLMKGPPLPPRPSPTTPKSRARELTGTFSDLADLIPGVARTRALARLSGRAIDNLPGKSSNAMSHLGRAGVALAEETGLPPLFGNRQVNAQDYAAPAQEERPAVADLPTLHYALQATLASGRAGLSPEDEQALTEAVVQGDQAAISATDFRLRQRYPAYARRVERELRAYNEED